MRVLPIVTAVAFVGATLAAQQPVPQPFPKPGQPTRPSPPAPAPQPPPAPPAPAPPPAPVAPSPKAATEPTEPALGAPVYPGALLIGSFDAGRGQRFYLFGTNTGFTEVVAYYRSALRQKGDKVFDEPPMHMFATGRFREETMAFPPSVTVKDYTWNRSEGYLNPRPGSGPARFKTVIQIVPAPPGQPAK